MIAAVRDILYEKVGIITDNHIIIMLPGLRK